MARTIKFKSTPSNWEKEYLGLKCNTVRIFEPKEDNIRLEIIQSYLLREFNKLDLEIENTKTYETFIVRISDITLFHIDSREVYILSWNTKK